MKSRVLLCLSIVISLLASIAINSFGIAFAVSGSDVTVTGNGVVWNTGEVNHIDSSEVNIVVTSHIAVDNLRCQLERADHSIVSSFDDCKNGSTGFVHYPDLNGEYIFSLEVFPTTGGLSTTLTYDFDTTDSGAGTGAEPAGSLKITGENITGSINFMSAITKAIASQIKTSLSNASSTAEKSIGNNSHSVGAHVSDENGYLVYVVVVVDSNGKVHKLIIDPSNGKILLSRELSGFEALMMLHQGMQGGGHNKSMMNPDFNYGHQMMNPGSNFER